VELGDIAPKEAIRVSAWGKGEWHADTGKLKLWQTPAETKKEEEAVREENGC